MVLENSPRVLSQWSVYFVRDTRPSVQIAPHPNENMWFFPKKNVKFVQVVRKKKKPSIRVGEEIIFENIMKLISKGRMKEQLMK